MIKNFSFVSRGFALARPIYSYSGSVRLGNASLQTQKFNFGFQASPQARYFCTNPQNDIPPPGFNGSEPDSEQMERLYKPKNRLTFVDGEAQIYTFKDRNYIRAAHLILYGILGVVFYLCAKRVIKFKERSWIGAIFYTIIGIWTFRLIRFTALSGSKIITDVNLKQDGRHVKFTTLTYGLYPSNNIIKNSTIAKPVDITGAVAQYSGFGFPIVADNQMYIVPRFGEIKEDEVLPAIFNGFNIDTTYIEDEIIIEP